MPSRQPARPRSEEKCTVSQPFHIRHHACTPIHPSIHPFTTHRLLKVIISLSAPPPPPSPAQTPSPSREGSISRTKPRAPASVVVNHDRPDLT